MWPGGRTAVGELPVSLGHVALMILEGFVTLYILILAVIFMGLFAGAVAGLLGYEYHPRSRRPVETMPTDEEWAQALDRWAFDLNDAIEDDREREEGL
jgi:hypothetical protein